MTEAYIAFGDTVIEGRGRATGTTNGELVFTTGYTGYEESLTDPSYYGQVLCFAYPLIGNYGVNPARFENDSPTPRACIARRVTESVADWLDTHDVPVIDNVDTRAIVSYIRRNGAVSCGISVGDDASPAAARAQQNAFEGISAMRDIQSRVGVAEHTAYNESGDGPTVALIDCGAKQGIIDQLIERDAVVHRHPATTTYDAVQNADIVFISNGPGDPTAFSCAEAVAEQAIDSGTPLAGICLGQQVIANAVGGSTEKMRFGHRGVNQPVYDKEREQVVITTQNHGYAVDKTGSLTVTQHNVNDGTPEALEDAARDIYTRQYHPEANPGPHDTRSFFDRILCAAKN